MVEFFEGRGRRPPHARKLANKVCTSALSAGLVSLAVIKECLGASYNTHKNRITFNTSNKKKPQKEQLRL